VARDYEEEPLDHLDPYYEEEEEEDEDEEYEELLDEAGHIRRPRNYDEDAEYDE